MNGSTGGSSRGSSRAVGTVLALLAACAPFALAADNLVRNPSFEEGSAAWSLPEQLYHVDTTVARSGKASLRFHNVPGGPYLLASQPIPLGPGKSYRMSVWVKTEAVASTELGVSICTEWASKDGYLGGAYPPGVVGTGDWQRIVYETGPVPKEAIGASVTVYGRSGTSGTAWFDDVEVVEVAPLARVGFVGFPPDVKRVPWYVDATAGGPAVEVRLDRARREEERDLVFSVTVRRGPQTSRIDAKEWHDGMAVIAIPSTELGSGETAVDACLRRRSDDRPVRGEMLWVEGRRLLRLEIVAPNSAGVLGLNGHVESSVGALVSVLGDEPGLFDVRLSWRRGGRAVGRAAGSTVRAGGATRVSVPVPGGLPPGICDLRCEVVQRGGQHVRVRTEALVTLADPSAKPANATRIGADRLLMVDGKPFFPIGFYILSTLKTVFPADKPYQWQDAEQHPDYYLPILDRLSQSRFNTVIDYGSAAGGIEQAREFMDAAHARGIHTIFSVKDLMKGAYWEMYTRNLPTKDLREANRLLVRTFRDHPSLIAWYINDEVFTPDLWQGAVDVFRDTRETDPWHPTYAVHYDYKGLGTYRSACDVIGTDPYTLTGDIGFTARSWREARQIIGQAQPFWAVVQCFGAGYEVSNPADTREPSYGEERAATLAAVAEGATGIIYYCYHSLERSPRFAERFAELDRIAAEVQSLLPVIELPDAEDPVRVTKGTDVSVLTKQGAGRLHALVVSTSRTDQDATLDLPRVPRSVEILGTGERLRASGRSLTLHLPALAVRHLVIR